MASLLTLLRPFDYRAVHRVLLVQTGSLEQTRKIAAALRKHFPECRLDGVVGPEDAASVAPEEFQRLTIVCREDRFAALRTLRAEEYDAVAYLLGNRGSRFFRSLPYLLRTRNVLLFNDNADYFPLKWTRLHSLAQHLSGKPSLAALAGWLIGRVVVVPMATLMLLFFTAKIQLRAALRRRSRMRRAHLSAHAAADLMDPDHRPHSQR